MEDSFELPVEYKAEQYIFKAALVVYYTEEGKMASHLFIKGMNDEDFGNNCVWYLSTFNH